MDYLNILKGELKKGISMVKDNLTKTDLEKKLNCRSEKWRKILKDLFLIEHILRTGNPRFADDLKNEDYKIKNLTNFSYYDKSNSDKGETSK